MIYVTGDIHGDACRFSDACMPGESEFGAQDYVVVCGDFGLPFLPPGTRDYEEKTRALDGLATRPYTILFVDGNHENFDLLDALPVREWKGGKVHFVRPNIIHLMRGQIYDIDGLRVFTMGGAYSADAYRRSRGFSVWTQELPSNEEYHEAIANLKAAGNEVDVILTHTAPTEVIRMLGHDPRPADAELTGFLEWILHEVKFRRWYFGHWHTDLPVTYTVRAVYWDLVPLDIQ